MKLMSNNEVFLLEEIVRRNFSSKYKDSYFGILWSVVKPLLIMIVFTVVFSTLFKGSVENFPVYILSGKCIYDFFTGGVGLSMLAIKSNKNILQKTPAPKYIFVLGGVISEFLNLIISLILLIGVMIVTKNPFYFNIMPLSIIPVMSITMLILGLSLMLSIATVYYTDIRHLWSVLTLIIMYASALFYPMKIVPDVYRQYLILNPIFWAIDQFRDFIAYGTIPDLSYVLNSLLLSSIILVMGIIIFIKFQDRTTLKL